MLIRLSALLPLTSHLSLLTFHLSPLCPMRHALFPLRQALCQFQSNSRRLSYNLPSFLTSQLPNLPASQPLRFLLFPSALCPMRHALRQFASNLKRSAPSKIQRLPFQLYSFCLLSSDFRHLSSVICHLISETSYETRPKWHSFFFDLTGRFFGRRLGWHLKPNNRRPDMRNNIGIIIKE